MPDWTLDHRSLEKGLKSIKIVLPLLCLLLALGLSHSGRAQVSANISVDPQAGKAGTAVWLNGSGFSLGGYPGTILWDDQPLQTFDIPQGGDFRVAVVVPMTAVPGSHTIAVCAGAPCGSGGLDLRAATEFEVTAASPRYGGNIAYVFAQNEAPIKEAQEVLSAFGFVLHPIPLNSVLATDFRKFDLVIVGEDTGAQGRWGTAADQVKQIALNPKVLGLGQGGYAFFGQLQLAIGYPNGPTPGKQAAVFAADPALSLYKSPYNLTALLQDPLAIYTDTVEFVAIPSQDVPGDVYPIGESDPQSGDATLISQGCHILWGYTGSPRTMTDIGRHLFANTVAYLAGSPCTTTPTAVCQPLRDPGQIPASIRVDFDDLSDGVAISDHYQATHGVALEDGKVTRAITYSDRESDVGKSHSPPNVAINSAISPSTSENVPMSLFFAQDQSHTGLWLGNGKDASGNGPDIAATLTAYDRSGEPICQASLRPVPASHTAFIGLYDAYGRIARLELDYGGSLLSESIDDVRFGPFTPTSRIRVCRETATPCSPVAGAIVHRFVAGRPVGLPFTTDGDGYLVNRNQVDFGDALYALEPVSTTEHATLFHTNGAPQPVTIAAFNQEVTGTMALVVSEQNPLMLHDLDVATQWTLTADDKAQLQENLYKVSDYLYDFTDGQMALGKVNVYQNYDNWDGADIWLFASNNLRPSATVGGVLTTPATDPTKPTITYYPGQVYIGSTWNRFHLPGDNLPPDISVDVSEDWPLALAHELGHYLLFLFDTYLQVDVNGAITETDTCTGSAMGWVYEPANTEFIADADHWNASCDSTVANYLLQRTEWVTLGLWYNWLLEPVTLDPGPAAPPLNLTSVTFHPPLSSTLPLNTQLFQLAYQDGETASAEARAFLIRDQRVLDQGKPAAGTTEIELHGAQVADRFCVFDINDHAEGEDVSRHQYGCEELANGDNQLWMEKDPSWSPLILLSPVTSTTVGISVTQSITDTGLRATLYPENKAGATEIALTTMGDRSTGTFNLPEPTNAAYVAVWMDEEASELDPRRETMVDYGVVGGGVGGPTSRLDSAPVVSSDGKAVYNSDEARDLALGEFIAFQMMAGTPALPEGQRVLGQSYNLIALPADLADSGAISIRYQNIPAAQASALDADVQDLAIHFWSGSRWQELSTTFTVDNNDDNVATAESQGVGVYALLEATTGPGQPQLYLPLLKR